MKSTSTKFASFITILFLALFVQTALYAGEKTVKIQVDGMHCHGCSSSIKKELKKLKGVKSAEVDHNTKVATIKIDTDNDPGLDALKNAIKMAGYSPTKVLK